MKNHGFFDRVIVPPDYGDLFFGNNYSFLHRTDLSNLKVGDVWYLTDHCQLSAASKDAYRNRIKREVKSRLGSTAQVSLKTAYLANFECIRLSRTV